MNIKSFAIALALMLMPALSFAQTTKSNEALSAELKNKIEVINADIKVLNAKLKADKENQTLISELSIKKDELKKAKEQKKIIDNAISAEKNAQKQAKAAEKASEANAAASKTADKLRASNAEHAGKSNELLSDELDNKIDVLNAEIKALKARRKIDPSNQQLVSEIATKNTELKEAKRQKKVYDEAIKADKTAKKKVKQANNASDKNDKAADKAESVRQNYQE